MARQILRPIDLRSSAERQGVTRNQQTIQSIAGLFEIAGQAEQVRQDRQDLDRIARALANGETSIEAIAAVAKQKPEFSGGITGGLQRFASAFQPSPGGIGQGIDERAIGSKLSQILNPSLLSPEEERELKLFGQRDRPGAAAVAGPTKQQTQRDRDLATLQSKTKSPISKTEARKRLDKDPSQPRNPVPTGGTYDEFLEQANEEAIEKGRPIKEGKLFGKKAYEATLKIVEDVARSQGLDPKGVKVDFDRWWDARVNKEQGPGIFKGALTPNTLTPRKKFQKGVVEDNTLDEATATQILQEAGGDKDKAREIARQRGLKF